MHEEKMKAFVKYLDNKGMNLKQSNSTCYYLRCTVTNKKVAAITTSNRGRVAILSDQVMEHHNIGDMYRTKVKEIKAYALLRRVPVVVIGH